MVRACQPSGGNGATGAVFLLLKADLDSVTAVNDALEPSAKLRENLLGLARDWAVIAPGEDEIDAWRRHLSVPQH
jgi:hypothetical protein